MKHIFQNLSFIAPRKSQKNTKTCVTFVTGVKPTSWCLLRPWYKGLATKGLWQAVFLKPYNSLISLYMHVSTLINNSSLFVKFYKSKYIFLFLSHYKSWTCLTFHSDPQNKQISGILILPTSHTIPWSSTPCFDLLWFDVTLLREGFKQNKNH